MESAAFNQWKKTLVFFRDCRDPLGGEDTFEVGDSRVVTTEAGTYRENAAKVNSRFGYSFTLRCTDKPHLIELVYPDDKPRTICVQDGTCYDLTMGLVTGFDHPVTGTMQTAYNIFWPRALDQSILIATLSANEPSAAASIAVYELESLPDADLHLQNGFRTFGIQYEDPCNVGSAEGSLDFDTWLKRHMEYMRATGQNRLVYPINWYHGPIIPVNSQPHSRFVLSVVPEGRRRFIRSTFDTPDWLEKLLLEFDREGYHFTGSMTLMRLGNLMERMNLDTDAIAAGADTPNNILYNGSVQPSTNDWTLIYHPINYPQAVAAGGDGDHMQYAYGEHLSPERLNAPIFNVLHPEVQRQILEYFKEIAAKYAHHPSFEGISVNFWHGTMLWFANLLVGYDDVCASRFTDETGITLPVDAADPNRFAKRYCWLMEHAREAWIEWRCRAVCGFLLQLRDCIRAVREDLVFGINIWNETSGSGYYPGREGFPEAGSCGAQFGCTDSLYELYRRGGIDLSLLVNQPNIRISVERDFCRNATASSKAAIQSRHLIDPAWLDRTISDVLRYADNSEGFHFNCWVERWGRSVWFAVPEEDEPHTEKLLALPDFRAQYLFRENSYYDDEDKGAFFYPSQYRITAMFPPESQFAEWMSADLALHDALSVTLGGLYLDKQHFESQLAFAREYRRLPAKKFTDVYGMTDPVCMRRLDDGERTWVYALNREPYEIRISFTLGDRAIKHILPPFALKVWDADGSLALCDVQADIPKAVTDSYCSQARAVLAELQDLPAELPETLKRGAGVIEMRICEALDAGHLSELRHLLQSYVVKAIHQAVSS